MPPAENSHVLIERDLKATMSDGVVLLADRYTLDEEELEEGIQVRETLFKCGVLELLLRLTSDKEVELSI